VIEPSFSWWSGAHHEGKRVSEDFCYTSANAPQRLNVETLRDMLHDLGFLRAP